MPSSCMTIIMMTTMTDLRSFFFHSFWCCCFHECRSSFNPHNNNLSSLHHFHFFYSIIRMVPTHFQPSAHRKFRVIRKIFVVLMANCCLCHVSNSWSVASLAFFVYILLTSFPFSLCLCRRFERLSSDIDSMPYCSPGFTQTKFASNRLDNIVLVLYTLLLNWRDKTCSVQARMGDNGLTDRTLLNNSSVIERRVLASFVS